MRAWLMRRVLRHGRGIDDDRKARSASDRFRHRLGRSLSWRTCAGQRPRIRAFGGVSGSAVADATALGGLLVPLADQGRLSRAFCGATIAAASTIDILIPPSIPLILYSLVSNASIGALFVAGIVPGLLLAVGFLAVCNISARVRGFPYQKQPVAWDLWPNAGSTPCPH